MATNQRRRERYAQDETYRERRLRETREKREAAKMAKERLDRLRGWFLIESVPDDEVVFLFDPAIFWPVIGHFSSVDNEWVYVHYDGIPLRPTHWRPLLAVPLI
jgi:hypothetical protein